MSFEQLLKKLNIDKTGSYDGKNSYVVDLDSDDEWGKIFTKLDSNEDLDELEANGFTNEHSSQTVYQYEDQFMITLSGDLDADKYELIINEI